MSHKNSTSMQIICYTDFNKKLYGFWGLDHGGLYIGELNHYILWLKFRRQKRWQMLVLNTLAFKTLFPILLAL